MSGAISDENQQKSRRELLEEWKAAKAAQKQPQTAVKAQRVPVHDFHSERKLNTGAIRVQVHTPGGHLATPALRVPESGRGVSDDGGETTTTPIMAAGRAKTASRLNSTARKEVPPVTESVAPASLRKQVSFSSVIEAEKRVSSSTTATLQRQATWSALTPKERKHVSFAPATETKVVNRVHRFVPRTVVTQNVAPGANQTVALRLSSALHAAHRHTKAGNLLLARRIYTGMLCDRERFQNVEASAQFWIQFALFEEHCGKYVAALKLYERGLNAGAQPNGEVESNLYVFMMRMDDRLERATKGGASVEEVKELQEFVSCVRAKEVEQHNPIEKTEEKIVGDINNNNNNNVVIVPAASVAGGANVASVTVAPEIERAWQIEHRNATEIAQLAGKDVSQLMEQRVASTDSQKVDEEATRLEQEGPRRSARLATKERKNYADPASLIPWWLRDDAAWDF